MSTIPNASPTVPSLSPTTSLSDTGAGSHAESRGLATAARTPAERAIAATIDHYVRGLRQGDPEILRQGFHEQAIMTGYLNDAPLIVPIQGLYDFVRTQPAPAQSGEPFEAEITSIRVSGHTATAELAERSYLGMNFRTSFQLLELEGRWWIMAKLFDTLAPSRQQ